MALAQSSCHTQTGSLVGWYGGAGEGVTTVDRVGSRTVSSKLNVVCYSYQSYYKKTP